MRARDSSRVDKSVSRDESITPPVAVRRIPALVHNCTSEREIDPPSMDPMSSSEPPSAYEAAVSSSVPPASKKASNWAPASSGPVSRLQVMVPSARDETTRPLVPTRLRCMRLTLPAASRPPEARLAGITLGPHELVGSRGARARAGTHGVSADLVKRTYSSYWTIAAQRRRPRCGLHRDHPDRHRARCLAVLPQGHHPHRAGVVPGAGGAARKAPGGTVRGT